MSEQRRPDEPAVPATLCPYCGHMSGNPKRCRVCGGLFDPLSRQATQNTMGPWYVRDEAHPFLPGCSYGTMRRLVRRGKVGRASIVRGPTTMQFWVIATRAPGIAHLLGECHGCHASVSPEDDACPACGVGFEVHDDRQRLGLAPVHLLPGQASPQQIAESSRLREAVEAPPDDHAPPALAEPDVAGEEEAAPPSGRPRTIGRALTVLFVLIVCAAAGYLGVRRGLFEIPGLGIAPGPEPVAEEGSTESPAAERVAEVGGGAEEGAEADGPVSAAAAGAADSGRTDAIALLRQGRLGAAMEAAESGDAGLDGIQDALSDRARRDRILALLGG